MFEGIGNIGMYAKTQMLKLRANKNIQSSFTYGKDDNKQQGFGTLPKITVRKGINLSKSTFRLKLIQSKLARGKKLSAVELDYLRQNAHELYAKAVRVNQDREELERRLKTCKTKDEALQVQRSFVSTATAADIPSSSGVGGIGGIGGAAGVSSATSSSAPTGDCAAISALAASGAAAVVSLGNDASSVPASTNVATAAAITTTTTTTENAWAKFNAADNDIDLPEGILRQRAMDDAWNEYKQSKKYRNLATTEQERHDREKTRKISIKI